METANSQGHHGVNGLSLDWHYLGKFSHKHAPIRRNEVGFALYIPRCHPIIQAYQKLDGDTLYTWRILNKDSDNPPTLTKTGNQGQM